MTIRTIGLVGLLSTGCATADQVQKIDDRIVALEAKITALEEASKAAPAAARAARGGEEDVDPAKEEAAQALYKEINELRTKGDFAGAKEKANLLSKDYGDTRTGKRAVRVVQELEVIGKTAPTTLTVEKWFQGEGEVNIADASKPTLVVFWEEWCPHCKREVPELQATYEKYKPKGLQVVGMTKITRKSTEEGVVAFLKDNKVGYPVAKETGELSEYFNVSGIPAAAVVKGGQIVWRGHPGQLTDEMLEGWL